MREIFDERIVAQEYDKLVVNEYLRMLSGSVKKRRVLTWQQRTFIQNRVARLPQEERLTIYLLFWEDRTMNEIAKVIGCTRRFAEKLAHSAMNRLRNELQILLREERSARHLAA
jgi:DNA-directed RNA polymerase specialized sigma24 family protein